MNATAFPTPATFFRWCVETIDDPAIPFRQNYPQYAAASSSSYLWETYDRRLADIIQMTRPGLRVLEVGCGIGSDLCWLALHGARVTGIDVKSEWVAAAAKLSSRVSLKLDLRRINLLDMPAAQFDLIYMKDTFHHLEPREAAVEKLASMLAPGGAIVIVEPNALNPFIQLKMFSIRGFNTIITKTDTATGEPFTYGNERLVRGSTIARLFRKAGVDGKAHLFRLVPTALAQNSLIVKAARTIERRGLDAILVPVCIHCVYKGYRLANTQT